MKDKINKIVNVLKKYGLIVTIKKSFKYFSSNYLNKINIFSKLEVKFNAEKYKNEFQKILDGNFDRIIVWRGNFGWNVPLYQRPQHMAKEIAKNNSLVLYEVTTFTDKVKTISKINNNLYLVNFNNLEYSKLLFEVLDKINKPKYLQIYSTEWQMSINTFKSYINRGYKVIYEYIDELTADIAGTKDIPKNVIDKFNYAMKDTQNVYVVATADKLRADVEEIRGENKVIFSTNGVDYDFYQQFDEYDLEDSYLDIINNGKINIGYYGALAKWFDYELIKKINNTNKYNIILFGVKYDDSYDDSGINDLENVYYMGTKDYKILKYYAVKIDVLTIPFLLNDITKSTSPLKLFEYMALHKPIVTTNMNECQKYSSVIIGKTHASFLKNLKIAYDNRNDKQYMKLLDKQAQENSWDSKAKVLIDYLSGDEKELL